MPDDKSLFGEDRTEEQRRDAELRSAERETQLDGMRKWFYENYTDPVENTPYESAEDGYIYIWGGPFDAHQELSSEFGHIVPDDVIAELADELSDITPEWTGNPDSGDVDDYFIDSISDLPLAPIARANLSGIRSLLSAGTAKEHEQRFNGMLYVNVITALETFLSDFFISTVIGNQKLLRKFVETNPNFRDRKISLCEVYSAAENIKDQVQSDLLEMVWHRFDRIKPMFSQTMGLDLSDIGDLTRAVLVRHDLVHRNGKTKNGKERAITRDQVEELISTAERFIAHMEDGWQKVLLEEAEDSPF